MYPTTFTLDIVNRYCYPFMYHKNCIKCCNRSSSLTLSVNSQRISLNFNCAIFQVSDDEVTKLVSNSLQTVKNIFPEFDKFSFSPRTISDNDSGELHRRRVPLAALAPRDNRISRCKSNLTLVAVVAMFGIFEDLGMIAKWRIARDSLARFILLVRRGYR